MAKSHLEKLEQAYLRVMELESPAKQEQFLSQLAAEDAGLAEELRQLLSNIENPNSQLDISRNQFFLMTDSHFGEGQKSDAYFELVNMLKTVCPSQQPDVLGEIEGFELQRLVGIGATGFVFQAWDPFLKRPVAIKILSPSIAGDPKKKESFVEEARLASSIQSPNVATIFHVHFSADPDIAFFVMEWIEGFSLQQWIGRRDEGGYSERSISFFRQLINAVSAIHQKGIIHRDLKPSNILLEDNTDRLVVVDFGLAFEDYHTELSRLPAGTPLFMSPEQLNGDKLGPASDLFAIAEITCLVFFGFHPYQQKNLGNLADHILHDPPTLPLKSIANRQVEKVLSRALEKNPEQRYNSVTEYCEQFLLALEQPRMERAENATAELGAAGVGSRSKVFRNLKVLVSIFVLLSLTVAFLRFQREWPKTRKPDNSEVFVSGKWINQDAFENFAGMRFRRIIFDGTQIGQWPPDPNYPDVFAELGWRNMNVDILCGESLLTIEQYLSVVGDHDSQPQIERENESSVTNISFDEAEAFCRELTRRDPDGIIYKVCSPNDWTYASYGHALMQENIPTAEIVGQYRSRHFQSLQREHGLIKNLYGQVLEWSDREKLMPTRVDGIVSFKDRPFKSADEFVEVIGGGEFNLHVHAFDMNFGINDNLEKWSGLTFRAEEDGNTCYLHPTQSDTEARLIYTYRVPPIVSASLKSPFSLFTEYSQAGIRIRGKNSGNTMSLDECPWTNVCEFNGKHLPPDNPAIELTQHVKGLTDVQIEYWIKTEGEKLHYSQIGRTSKHNSLPNVFCVEFLTENTRTSPRQFCLIPKKFKSPNLGFRLVGILNGKTKQKAPAAPLGK